MSCLSELAGRLHCRLQDGATCCLLTSLCLTCLTLQVGLYGSALLLMFFLEYYNLLSGAAGLRAEHKYWPSSQWPELQARCCMQSQHAAPGHVAVPPIGE